MMRTPVVLALTAFVCAPSIARAQTPDFSGTWVPDPSRSVMTGMPACDGAVASDGSLQPPVKITDVRPAYPDDVFRNRIAGVVILEATVDKTGSIANAKVIRSIPELDQAALDAVRRWKYRPATLSGTPVPMVVTTTVRFSIPGVSPAPGVMTPAVAAMNRVTIVQDAASLTAMCETPGGPQYSVYRLDGSEVRSVLRARGSAGTPSDVVSRSGWENDRLITTVTSPGREGQYMRTETRYLEGDAMVVEVVTQGAAGAAPLVQKQVYKKTGGA